MHAHSPNWVTFCPVALLSCYTGVTENHGSLVCGILVVRLGLMGDKQMIAQ